jgi:predicted AAA+ superfamily ATPase
MRRIAEKYLQDWFSKKNRMPLILRGARQVGKSTLVKIFCESQEIDLIEINLEKEKLKSASLETFSIQDVLDEIQFKTKKIISKNSIIFLDEIQEQPKLLSALRYFFEERPDVAVIAAGSLLEIALKTENFSFPVGRIEFYHLGPMTFTEYLWATNNNLLATKIANLDFSPGVHEKAKAELRKYYYVGGMPYAIKTYIESKSLVPVRAIQEQILQAYTADFPKYNSRIQVDRIQRVFAATVQQLGKKIIYQRIDSNAQAKDTRRVIELLIDARVLLPCLHSDGNNIPLLGEADSSIQKLYFLDVGLMNCLMRLDLEAIDLEFENNFNTKGIISEQFVAQHLAYIYGGSIPPELFYWLKDKGSQKGEIDFLLQNKNKITPIEVKSTKGGHLKSLFYFAKEKKKTNAIKISMDEYSVENVVHKIDEKAVALNLTNLPLYAVGSVLKIST